MTCATWPESSQSLPSGRRQTALDCIVLNVLSSGTNGAGNDIVWFKNNGSSNFSTEQVIDNTQSNTFKFIVEDFDNDGDLDIASAAYNNDQISIFNNQKFVLSIEEFQGEIFRLYPNPVIDYLRIDTSVLNESGYTIYNVLGNKLMEGTLITNTSIDVTQLNSSIYYFQLKDSGKVYKFIKN